MSNVAFWMIYSTSLVVSESVSARVFAVGSRSMSLLTPSARSCSFPSHTISQVMLVYFPDVRLLPAVSVSVVA